jgi:hypothetical protein
MLIRRMLAGLAVACSMALVPGVQAQCSGDVNGDGRVDGIDGTSGHIGDTSYRAHG